MYITSECYGIARILNIKCPIYSTIQIHDVVLGVKDEPFCPPVVSSVGNMDLNPICCRPSCNDCFQTVEAVMQSISKKCDGHNACRPQPQWEQSGNCGQALTRYMAVAYNCEPPANLTDFKLNPNTTFSIVENLCGRPPDRLIIPDGGHLPDSLQNQEGIKSSIIPLTEHFSKRPVLPTALIPESTKPSTPTPIPSQGSLLPTKDPSTSTHSSTSQTNTTSSQRPLQPTGKTTLPQTTPPQRVPTKRFVPSNRLDLSSHTTSSQLESSNISGSDFWSTDDSVGKGAVIGGVVAGAGLLVLILVLALLRRRRRKLNSISSSHEHFYDDVSEDQDFASPRPGPSTIDDVTTPTSAEQEGQYPWRFGPPDLDYDAIVTEGEPASTGTEVSITDAQNTRSGPPSEDQINTIYAVVDKRLSTTKHVRISSVYDEIEELGPANENIQSQTTATVHDQTNAKEILGSTSQDNFDRNTYQSLRRQNFMKKNMASSADKDYGALYVNKNLFKNT